jgi:peroxiredoxin
LASQLKLGFPILEDRDHRLGSAFDVYRLPSGMDMGAVDNHSIFVIDASGHVAWKQLAPDTMHVPIEQVIAAVRAA